MRPLRTRPFGFTLLELLVVVAIVGVLVTLATLAISNRAGSDTLETEAKRLQQLLSVALEDAEMGGLEIGFVLTDGGYAFVAVAPNGKWAPLREGPLRPRALPPPLTLTLKVDGRPVAPVPSEQLVAAAKSAAEEQKQEADGKDPAAADPGLPDDKAKDKKGHKASDAAPLKPQLLLLSSGEASSATLDVAAPGVAEVYVLEIDSLGRISRSSRPASRPR